LVMSRARFLCAALRCAIIIVSIWVLLNTPLPASGTAIRATTFAVHSPIPAAARPRRCTPIFPPLGALCPVASARCVATRTAHLLTHLNVARRQPRLRSPHRSSLAQRTLWPPNPSPRPRPCVRCLHLHLNPHLYPHPRPHPHPHPRPPPCHRRRHRQGTCQMHLAWYLCLPHGGHLLSVFIVSLLC